MEELYKILQPYSETVEQGLNERWKQIPVEIYDSEIYEVIGGLLSRQAALTIHLAMSPYIWTAHIAPLILRSMSELYITLSWIMIDPKERAKKYILYGLGQEKLFIEHLKSLEENERTNALIAFKEDWLNTQRRDFMIEINVGNWAKLDTRTMAKEANCEDVYKLEYTPFSAATHNMWQHIAHYNLKPCDNPLHKYHKVPEIKNSQVNPDFLLHSAKYLSDTFEIIDKKYNLTIKTMMPLDFLNYEFDKLAQE